MFSLLFLWFLSGFICSGCSDFTVGDCNIICVCLQSIFSWTKCSQIIERKNYCYLKSDLNLLFALIRFPRFPPCASPVRCGATNNAARSANTIHGEAHKYKYITRLAHMRRAAAEKYRCVASMSPEWGLGNNAGHDQNQNCGRTLPRGHIRAQQIRATVLQVELLLFFAFNHATVRK